MHHFKAIYNKISGFARRANARRHIPLITLLLALIMPWTAKASHPSTHYIISFDRAVPAYKDSYIDADVLRKLSAALDADGANPSTDYVSVVGYSFNFDNPTVEGYVKPYSLAEGKKMIWAKAEDFDLTKLLWRGNLGLPQMTGRVGSAQSFAKQYSVMETYADSKNQAHKHVDRTILLMVTDEMTNGSDDYRKEWTNISSMDAKFNGIQHDFISKIEKFDDEFVIQNAQFGTISKDGMVLAKTGPWPPYRIIAYEVWPNDKPSIHASTNFPSPLPLQRVRGGYRVDVAAQSLYDRYTINDITLLKSNGEVLGEAEDGELRFTIPSSEVSVGDTLTVCMSLQLNDSVYNGALMSSRIDRYNAGMTSLQVVMPEKEKVLGLLPLADAFWWWYGDDVFTAVMVWDLVILLILIIALGALIMWLIKKLAKYEPASDAIKTRPVKQPLNIQKPQPPHYSAKENGRKKNPAKKQ